MSTGYIYFVGSEHHTGPVKIGWSRDPHRRLQRLQTGHPEILVILATVPGTMEDEKRLQGHFYSARDGGEWYRVTDDMKMLLEAVSDMSFQLHERSRSKANVNRFLDEFMWLLERLDKPDPNELELLKAQKRALKHL